MNVGTGSFVTEWFAGLKLSKFEVHHSSVKLSSMPDISLQYDITTPTKQWSPNKFGLRAVSSPLNAPNIIQCASSLLLAFCVRSFYPSNLHLNHMRLACGAREPHENRSALKNKTTNHMLMINLDLPSCRAAATPCLHLKFLHSHLLRRPLMCLS